MVAKSTVKALAVLAALAGAVPFAAQAARNPAVSEPVCADRSGEKGYAAPRIDLLGSAPEPACVRDELPPLG